MPASKPWGIAFLSSLVFSLVWWRMCCQIPSAAAWKSEGKSSKNSPDCIKKKTMNVLMSYLNKNVNVPLTCEEVSKKVKMSIVTVRHYFRHLVDKGILDYEYDYSTGGRPETIYVYKK